MNPPRLNASHPGAAFDSMLDAALGASHDAILPSSGFAESVMAEVHRQSAAPAPIPFPWKRALPGLAAAAAALGILLVAVISVLRTLPRTSAPPVAIRNQLLPLLHQAAGQNVLALTLSLAVALMTLLLCRRLLTAR